MDLFDKMSLFGKVLDEHQREHLLVTALYNDLRLYEDDGLARINHIRRAFAVQKESLVSKFGKV